MAGLLAFHPLLKRIRWGGTRLGSLLGKPIGEATDAAESWEVCDHGADQSVVASGPWQGRSLADLVTNENRALFGRHAGRTQFPLLIKFLDATDRLSLQVHPNDVQAVRFVPDENGKTEAWVIVDAAPGSRIYAGLRRGVDRAALVRHLAGGTIEECLHVFEVEPGDCVFIPAGTVHAIGEGVLLAEVQQSSDITFRLHDWGRVGTDGKPRPVHVAESLECIDFAHGPVAPATPRELPATEFAARSTPDAPEVRRHEELVRCDYFVMRRHLASDRFALPADDRFHVLMILEGAATVGCGEASTHVARGATLLATASRDAVRIQPAGTVVVLDAFLP